MSSTLRSFALLAGGDSWSRCAHQDTFLQMEDGVVELAWSDPPAAPPRPAALPTPAGLAFDADGRLYVADALAGTGGIFRFPPAGGQPECVVAAAGLVGLAFGPRGSLAVCSADTVYRLDVGIRGLLPFTRQ